MPANLLSPGPSAPAGPRGELVFGRLRAMRRRLLIRRLIEGLSGAALLGAGGLVAAASVNALMGRFPVGWMMVAIGGVAVFAGAMAWTCRGWMSLVDTAALVDRRADARDRFSAALDFCRRPAGTLRPFEQLALAECGRFIESFPIAKWTPLGPVPRTARWLFVPCVSLVLLAWHATLPGEHSFRAEADPSLQKAAAERAAALQRLAAEIRKDEPLAKSPDARQLAADLDESAKRLKDASGSAVEEGQRKAALRELAALQAEVRKLRAERPSAAELSALAAALEHEEATKAAADALRAGDLQTAASQLEQLLQKLKEQGDPEGKMGELARSLQEQAGKLSEEEKSEVAQQMQEAAKEGGAGQAQLSEKAMRRLAELLRQAASGAGQQQGGQPQGGQGRRMTARDLQRLLNALENMQAGLGPGQPGGTPGDGSDPNKELALTMMDSFGSNPDQPEAPKDGAGQPGGTGGGNTHDPTDRLDPNPAAAPKPEGPASRLQGEVGESGESQQEFLPVGGGAAGHASRQYRQTYEAMAPAAQEAVRQENIPLGARFMVGRYFRNIRPPE